jgi:Flp pilus assembly protein TadG
MKPPAAGALVRHIKAATTVEFALVSVVLVAMLLGGIELGIALWTRGTLQAIAAQTARCASINSPLCDNAAATPPVTPHSYALGQATALLGAGLASRLSVSTGTASSCFSGPATTTGFYVVTISSPTWFGFDPLALFAPSSGGAASASGAVTACYPI